MDDDLRRLERAARERPDDRAAGWAFVRELARVGERRRRFHELCRLARLGDVEARKAVDRWHPWPGGPQGPRRRGIRSVARDATVPLELPGRVAGGAVLAATDTVLLLEFDDGTAEMLVAVDVASSRRLWMVPLDLVTDEPVPVVLVGDEVLHRQGDRELVRRDVATGGRRDIATGLAALHDLGSDGDRVVALGKNDVGETTLVAVDLGERSRELWRAVVPDDTRVEPRRGLGEIVLAWQTGSATVLEGRDLETGARRWRVERERPTGVLGADARGILVREVDAGTRDLDPARGLDRPFARAVGPLEGCTLTDEIVLVASERELSVVERDAGTVRWTARQGGRDAALGLDAVVHVRGRSFVASSLAAGDTVWRAPGSASWHRGRPGRPILLAEHVVALVHLEAGAVGLRRLDGP